MEKEAGCHRHGNNNMLEVVSGVEARGEGVTPLPVI
jgi:hypothetical protein